MKIIAKGNHNKLIVELAQSDLQLITGEQGEFNIDQEVDVSSSLNVLHQLTRKKDKYVVGLQDLANVINNL